MQAGKTNQISNRLQYQYDKQPTSRFKIAFKILKKASRSVCDNKSQQKQHSLQRRKRHKTLANPIIHSMFPKVRGQNSGFIQTLKLIKKRRLSHLLMPQSIGPSNPSSLGNTINKCCKDLAPTSNKINKIQQCQQQVKEYLQELNKRRKSQSFSLREGANANTNKDKESANQKDKDSNQTQRMQKSILSHVTIGQQLQRERKPIKRLLIPHIGYSQFSMTTVTKRQTIRESKSLNLHQFSQCQQQNLICKAVPMNTMQNTKNLFKTKTKINFDLSLNFDNISLQNNNDSLAKNQDFHQIKAKFNKITHPPPPSSTIKKINLQTKSLKTSPQKRKNSKLQAHILAEAQAQTEKQIKTQAETQKQTQSQASIQSQKHHKKEINIFKFGQKGLSPWQSYYPGMAQIMPQGQNKIKSIQ